jgi:tRNA A-37 threonylcarbamoyl transferase component Bud32
VAIRYIGNTNNKSVQELPWKKWIRAERETISLPISIILEDSSKALICEKILRFLPRKRTVMAGIWDDKPIVAKLFYGRNAKRHFKNEIKGATLLHQANVPSPQLLYHGSAYKNRVQVILFEKIENSLSLDSIWQQRTHYAEINTLMASFIVELATQHVLGILQQDLHMNNFLVTNKRIYTLDGSTIIHFENPLDKKKSLENLGLFFAQLGAGTKTLQQDLFQVYVKARGWLVKKSDLNFLSDAIKVSWQDRWRRYRRKIFRNSTTFKKIDKLFQRMIYDKQYQSPAFLSVLQNPDKIFTDPHTTILKNGRSSTVAKISIDNRFFVIKRYNLKNISHWLRRCLRATRAKTAWRLAQRLSLFGVPTAQPIAYVEKHIFGLNSTSYFLMEYLPGSTSGEFFSPYQPNDPQYEFMAKRVLQLLSSLTECQLIHSDLKETNIIIHDNQPKLIDLDGMSEHTITANLKRAYKKAIQRFMKNWNNQPDIFGLFEGLLKKMDDSAK